LQMTLRRLPWTPDVDKPEPEVKSTHFTKVTNGKPKLHRIPYRIERRPIIRVFLFQPSPRTHIVLDIRRRNSKAEGYQTARREYITYKISHFHTSPTSRSPILQFTTRFTSALIVGNLLL